mgnify:CR=1 FL=1
MSYCHKCGKKNKEGDAFCQHCGANLKDLLEETEEKIEKEVRKTSYRGLVIFIIFLLVIGYVILDLWAMFQLTPVITVNSVLTSVSNFQGGASLSQESISTTIRMENPTFVPILFGRIAYDANYGATKIAEGKTGFFIMNPYSQEDIPSDLTVYNLNALKSGVSWIWNTITGNQEKAYVNVYVDFGIFKFKVKTIE